MQTEIADRPIHDFKGRMQQLTHRSGQASMGQTRVHLRV